MAVTTGLARDEEDATAEAMAQAARARRARGPGRPRFDDVWAWVCVAVSTVVVLAGLVRSAPAVGHALGAPGGAAARTVLVASGLLLWAAQAALCVRLGPVLLGTAEITWLLPLPGDRGRLLRPRLTRAVVVATLAGLLTGTLAAALALLLEGRPRFAVLPVALGAHLALAWIAVAVGTLIEVRPALAGRARALGTGSAVIGCAIVFTGPAVPSVTPLAALCGPGGWAAWATAGAAQGAPLAWSVALGALLLCAAVALRAAFGAAAAIPTAELLQRGRTSRRAAQGATLLDLRALTLVLQSAGRRRGRLRMPRSRWAVIVWRDAVVLLRHPGRLAASLVALSAGAAATHLVARWLSESPHGPVGPLRSTAAGLILAVPLYLAAVALAEPAYQDTDRPRRALLLPFPPGVLAVGHLAVPVLLLWAAAAAAWSVAHLPGTPARDLTAYATALLLAGPSLVGSTLVGAYRGAPRYDLLALSLDWYAAVPFVLWRLAPALAAGFVVAPWLWHTVSAAPGASDGSAVLWLAARSAAVLAWSAHRVGRQARDLS
ncbi:DUF6297 family protein [Streptomyces spororaveus]|uniref:DUF6297 family protein n=1 Tax=Streptomyces spororaveus TaxID=284039 RepID=UPI0036A486E3